MHLSLDGFVAGPHGELNWVTMDEEIFDFVGQRIQKTATALYGRVTYQMMENYWPGAGARPSATRHEKSHAAWYNQAHKVVLSRTLRPEGLIHTEIIRDNLAENIQALKQSNRGGSEDILLFGSPTATHALMQKQLIDGYWLFVNPLVLGRGIPLFTELQERIKLELLSTHRFSNGVIELNYRVNRD